MVAQSFSQKHVSHESRLIIDFTVCGNLNEGSNLSLFETRLIFFAYKHLRILQFKLLRFAADKGIQ